MHLSVLIHRAEQHKEFPEKRRSRGHAKDLGKAKGSAAQFIQGKKKKKPTQLMDPVSKSHHKWWELELLGKRSPHKPWRSDRSYRSRHFMAFLWLGIPGGKRSQGSLEEREILLQPINSPDPKLGLAQLQGPVERNHIQPFLGGIRSTRQNLSLLQIQAAQGRAWIVH